MTEGALVALAEEAMVRWDVLGGDDGPPHRRWSRATASSSSPPRRRTARAALDSCAYLIDRLKTDAPFWKRERRGDSATWVEARNSDAAAAERWEVE
jgi:molybdopterin synthase catalytic subunit